MLNTAIARAMAVTSLSLFRRLVRRRHTAGASLPSLANDDRNDPHQPDKSGNDAVCDGAGAGVACEQETKTSVDHAEGQDDTAEPQVGVRPDCSALVLLVVVVVEDSEDGLEDEEDEKEDADYGVVLGKLSDHVS